MDDLEAIYHDKPQRCEAVQKATVGSWPTFQRCPNNATIRITGGSHEGHLLCHGHHMEWKDEAELDGYEELDTVGTIPRKESDETQN